MALYLGSSEELKINLDGVIYYLNLYSENPITNGIRLLSSDNYILKDSNGIYLTLDNSESPDLEGTMILLSDGSILKNKDGLYLTYKGSE